MISVKEIGTTSQETVTVTMNVEGSGDSGELMLATRQPHHGPRMMGLTSEQRLDSGAVLTEEEIETVERVTNMTATADGVQPANNRSKIFIKQIVFLTLYWFHFSHLLLLFLLFTSYTTLSIMCG